MAVGENAKWLNEALKGAKIICSQDLLKKKFGNFLRQDSRYFFYIEKKA